MKTKILFIILVLALFVGTAAALDNNAAGALQLGAFDANTVATPPVTFFAGNQSINGTVVNNTITYNPTLGCVDLNFSRINSGELYYAGLTPMTDGNITFVVGVDNDAGSKYDASILVYTSLGFMQFQRMSWGGVLVYATYTYDNGTVMSPSVQYEIHNADVVNGRFNFTLSFNSTTKQMIVYHDATHFMSIPYRINSDRQLPYANILTPVIYFDSQITQGNATYNTAHIYNITQTIPRRTVTPYTDRSVTGFGIDAPQRVYSQNGTARMLANGQKGTAWADVLYLTNDTIAYTNELLANGWELGIHFSQNLNTKPFPEAQAFIDAEMANITSHFGRVPVCFCTLQNVDNVTHAQYIWSTYGAVWRNGDSGVAWMAVPGNLDGDSWASWWSPAINATAIYPTFTHHIDQSPAITYSIASERFISFSDLYASNGIGIVGFREYALKSMTQNKTQITISENNTSRMTFGVVTSGYPTKIDVKTTMASPLVYTNNTSVSSTATSDGVRFTASNGTYIITNATLPTASFMKVGSSGAAPLTITFVDMSSGEDSLLWNFGDGNTSTEQFPSNTYTDQGTYEITVTATNAAGSITSAVQTVTVVDSNVIMLTQLDSTQPLDVAESTSSAVTILSAQTDSVMSGMMGSVISSINNGYALLSLGVIILAAAGILRYLGYL